VLGPREESKKSCTLTAHPGTSDFRLPLKQCIVLLTLHSFSFCVVVELVTMNMSTRRALLMEARWRRVSPHGKLWTKPAAHVILVCHCYLTLVASSLSPLLTLLFASLSCEKTTSTSRYCRVTVCKPPDNVSQYLRKSRPLSFQEN
jgi:hypothetical protein